eukprot:TRINITY_DN3037_c0_g3_i1.p1 TRINITY_DN3037_c0_g3~~TRINITY_DN3037_c0_g3_i1.p1  ORF type:complete len:355 (+),score=83.55 TRINITY_DN3037_c0_g3_i1:120-1184(+)
MEQSLSTKKRIGTHDGAFHMDEVLGCALLTRYTSEYAGAEIIRTRDKSILDTLDIVIDVGGQYIPEKNRLDHHQREFTETWSSLYPTVKLSSAGLVYKHFGHEILANALQRLYQDRIKPIEASISITVPDFSDKNTVNLIFERLYKNLFLVVDAIDNGVEAYPKDTKPLYKNSTGLEARVGRCNPPWFDENPDYYKCFSEAMKIAEDEFLCQLYNIAFIWLPSKKIVEKAVEDRLNFHPSGAMIFLDTSCPWKDHLYDIERELALPEQHLKYVIYTDRVSKTYRIQCVSDEKSTFTSRLPLHKKWRGVPVQELRTISGIADIVFVHATGFIGGAASLESVKKMGELTLNDPESQ